MPTSSWLPLLSDPSILFGQAKQLRAVPDKWWRFERVIDKGAAHRSATVQIGHRHAFVAQVGSVKELPSDKRATFPSLVSCAERPDHPHQKAVWLIEEHLCNWTPPGGVFDPFAGSGSTLIACENLHRRAYCIEIDPGYCDVIVDRWQRHTGQAATLGGPSRTQAPQGAS